MLAIVFLDGELYTNLYQKRRLELTSRLNLNAEKFLNKLIDFSLSCIPFIRKIVRPNWHFSFRCKNYSSSHVPHVNSIILEIFSPDHQHFFFQTLINSSSHKSQS